MSDYSKFKVVISLTKEGGAGIFYKIDGERFESKTTVKLNVETKYILTVTSRPPQTLEKIMLIDEVLTINRNAFDEEKAIYTASWPVVGLQTTKRTKRDKIPLTLQFKELGLLKVIIQMKFYKENDVQHATWGNALRQIELECEAKTGLFLVDVVKESYR